MLFHQETTMDYDITDGAREYKAGLPAGDAQDVYAAMMRTFEDFKSENDDRLKAIEKRGGDVIAEEKVARIGARPRQLITTTPCPLPIIKRLLADPRTRVTRAPTQANKDHLSPAFLENVVGRYAGTRMGRQELDGELIEDRPDALWSRGLIETCRVTEMPALPHIVVAIDPPGSSRQGADACGIVAVGRAEAGLFFVLEDASATGLSPSAWANKAVALYRRLNADSLIAEFNMGREMVRAVLREVDATVPLKEVHATRGK
jgi:phage terminase large subunit-like protein